MTPAALHRISFAGEDTPSFFTIGSWFVVLAPAPLAIGIAGDLYVATSTAATSLTLGAILAGAHGTQPPGRNPAIATSVGFFPRRACCKINRRRLR